jgi:hypothetical protein
MLTITTVHPPAMSSVSDLKTFKPRNYTILSMGINKEGKTGPVWLGLTVHNNILDPYQVL